MKVIAKQIDKKPIVTEMDNSLESLQGFIGGYLEVPFVSKELSKRNIVMIVDEEGNNKPLKPTVALVSDDVVCGVIVGNIIFCAIEKDDFIGLEQEQIDYIMNNITIAGATNNEGLEIDILRI